MIFYICRPEDRNYIKAIITQDMSFVHEGTFSKCYVRYLCTPQSLFDFLFQMHWVIIKIRLTWMFVFQLWAY